MKHIGEAQKYFGVRPYGWKRRAIQLFLRLMWARLRREDPNRPSDPIRAAFYEAFDVVDRWRLDSKAEEDLRRLGRLLGYGECNVASMRRLHEACKSQMLSYSQIYKKPYRITTKNMDLSFPVKLSLESGITPA